MTTTTPTTAAPARDRATVALGMTLTALLVSLAINKREGLYNPIALAWLTGGFVCCLLCVIIHSSGTIESKASQFLMPVLIFACLIQTCAVLYEAFVFRRDSDMGGKVFIIALLGLLQALNLRSMRMPLIWLMVVTFCAVAIYFFNSRIKDPEIDVFIFQQDAAKALSEGQNPYAIRFPNIYDHDTPFYGPGVVGPDNNLTYGFPYFPLSLLMVLPAYLIGADVRYAHVLAMGLGAGLIALARPSRRAPLAATLFLINPQGLTVIAMSWTEPLLVLTFSLTMLCALRWRKGLPLALGLFFATKQYTVLAVPAMLLLVDGPKPFKQFFILAVKAGLVAAVITLPFVAWNFHEFKRAVVDWQLVQPFRTDALSYLVWIFNHNGGVKPPIWTPFLVIVPAVIIALWRCARSPAGFAAAVTLIYITFFAFNKQAFCNYYYFVIATACWSVAAMYSELKSRPRAGMATDSTPTHVPLPSSR